MSPDLLRKIANFVWFQSIWLLTIIYQYELLIPVGILLLGFLFITDDRVTDTLVIAVIVVLGVATDSLLTLVGIFDFESPAYVVAIPLWLVALWMAFAGTLRHSLRYLMDNLKLAAVAGAFFGPLSYYAGMRLEAVTFGFSNVVTVATLGVVWAVVLPLSFWIARRCEQWRYRNTD